MRKHILWVLLAVIGLASCANPDKIAQQVQVKGFAGMETSGLSDVTLRFNIDNASRKTIHLKDGWLTLNDGKKTIAKITAENVTIHKRTSGIVNFPLKVTLNQIQMLISMNKLTKRPGELSVNGEVTIKSGILSKKFNFADKPLTDFLKDVGLDEGVIQKIID